MAKSKERNLARKLRKIGRSIKAIAKQLHVSASTVSIWCRDIILTARQIQRLTEQQRLAGYAGRLKGAQMQKDRRLALIQKFRVSGIKDIGSLNRRDLFILGLGIYAGEGFKYGNKAGFSNSDPIIVKVMLRWFREICNVYEDLFVCEVGINEMHRHRVTKVVKFWSKITGISTQQFWKTSLKKVKSEKIYENADEHFGTLAVRVRKSAELEYKILGWLHGIYKNL